MGTKPMNVGGGNGTSQVANGFNGFLNQQLGGGQFGNAVGGQMNGGRDLSGAGNFLQNYFNNANGGRNGGQQMPPQMQSPYQLGQGQGQGQSQSGRNWGGFGPPQPTQNGQIQGHGGMTNGGIEKFNEGMVQNMGGPQNMSGGMPQGDQFMQHDEGGNMMMNSQGPENGQAPPMFPSQPNPNGQNQEYQNPYQSPQYQNSNVQQLDTNMYAGQNGMANLGGFNMANPSNYDTQQGMGGGNYGGQSDYNSMLSGMLNRTQGNGGFSGASVGQVSMAPAAQIDANSPEIQASTQLARQQLDESNANLRARFGAAGAGAMGTGAQYAEAQQNAQAAPQLALATGQLIRGQQQQDLANRQGMANTALGNQGNQAQIAMGNTNAGVQAQGNVNNGNANTIQAALGARGQDVNQGMGNRGMDINQMGMGLQQSMGNQSQANNFNMGMAGHNIQNQGQGNNFQLGAGQQNSNNAQNNNLNSMNSAGAYNGFNLSNAGNMGQYGMMTNQLNSQNFNNMLNQGMGMNQMGNGNINQMLSQLFGGMQQGNQLGTPQAQTVMQQNPWMQGLGMLANGAGQYFGGGR